jgi:hypothetical protein
MGSGIDVRMNCTSSFNSPNIKSGAGNTPRVATPANQFAASTTDVAKTPQFATVFNANQPKTPTDWLQSTLGAGRILDQTA